MSSPAYRYTVGGSLEENAPTYVIRQADEVFYHTLKERQFCYVLNSRQTGKSSLRVQTTKRLQAEGIACGIIDISAIGSHNITPEEWYLGLIRRLARSLGLGLEVLPWWNDHGGLSPTQRLGEFLEDEVLAKLPQKQVVIFIDEIDSILRLDFKDDFFAMIRACYNQWADQADYHRLTFALLGVATPSDLIQDKKRTPFNIGQAIELQGFRPEEIGPLAQGLDGQADDPRAVLQAILDWTGGQPMLTQKLCQLIANSPNPIPAGSEIEGVEQQVSDHIIQNWQSQDEPEHLRTIENRIIKDEHNVGKLLEIYQQILEHGPIPDNDSPEHIQLRLSGLVVANQNALEVYNLIYQKVFNKAWITKNFNEIRFYAEALNSWYASGSKDNACLLQDDELNRALALAKNRNLSFTDQTFLTKSQEFKLLKMVNSIKESRSRLLSMERRLTDEQKKHEDLKNSAFGELNSLKKKSQLLKQEIAVMESRKKSLEKTVYKSLELLENESSLKVILKENEDLEQRKNQSLKTTTSSI
ncbi:MAG: hypothetical protein HC922_04305 [Leptolyngbyaceae cyanobacterium SM2_3_12]|nr:hypothetical protein [Leptolyngbyaceae cyanobacterium SM2_3_12]